MQHNNRIKDLLKLFFSIALPITISIFLFSCWNTLKKRSNELQHLKTTISHDLLAYKQNKKIITNCNDSHTNSCFDCLQKIFPEQHIVWKSVNENISESIQQITYDIQVPLYIHEDTMTDFFHWVSMCRLNQGCYEAYPIITKINISPAIDPQYSICSLSVQITNLSSKNLESDQ